MMSKSSILTILGLFLILEDCLAVEQFIKTPEKNSYADLGSDFLFNWTYAGPDSDIDIIKWYPSNAVGTAVDQLTMRFVGGGAVRAYDPRASRISNAVMLLKNISFADEGFFTCDITYINGRTLRNIIFLHVTIAPTLARHLSNTTIALINSQASWTCEFTSKPAAIIKWYLDGREMVSGSRYSINTTTIGVVKNATTISTTLTISSTQPEDTGAIQCSAIIPNHVISSSTNNIVYYPPRNTSLSSNILNVGALGETTTFTCLAQGNPQLSYQIYKDGALLSNTTSNTYVIAATQFNDTGLYWCIPVNYLGEGPKVEYNFTVYVSPKLQSQSPASIETSVGSYVSIHCAFSGLPAPIITWQKASGNISSAANISITTTTVNGSYPVVNTTMTFNTIRKDEHGVYECIARNPAGSPSAKISVNVTYQPIFSRSLSPNYTLSEDSRKAANWTCIATGNPRITIVWNINGKVPGSGYSVSEKTTPIFNGFQTESTLTLLSVTRNRSSIFSCNVTNSLGTIQSMSNLIINYHPSTSKPMVSLLNITEGEAISLSCEVDSQPQSQVYWEKDGIAVNNIIISTRVVESSSYTTKIQSNLTISYGNKSDEGLYKCVAVNSMGNLTQNAYVHVNYAPEFITSLQRTWNVLEGSKNYTLECVVRSKPLATMTWMKNGTLIQNSSKTIIEDFYSNENIKGVTLRSTMTLQNIEKDDYGPYTCRAENFVGFVRSEQLVVVTYRPIVTATSDSIVYVNATKNITLYCEFESSPSVSSLEWRLDNRPISSMNHIVSNATTISLSQYTRQRSELKVVSASTSDYGLYECEASNGIGRAMRNMTLVVYYAPSITRGIDGEQIANEGSSLNLSCHFTSNPKPDISWTLNSSTILNAANGYNISALINTQTDRALSNTTLLINNIQRNMQGFYACNARNHQGFVQSVVAVVVHYGPTFTSPAIARVEVDVGKNVTVLCQVESNPISNITWFKGGMLLSSNPDALISTEVTSVNRFKVVVTSILLIKATSKNVTGNYSCQAAKDNRVQHQPTMVVARYAPILTYNFTAQQNLTASPDMVVFTCTVESYPTSVILWYKDGSRYVNNIISVVKTAESSKSVVESSLVFPSGIKRTDYGRYSCNATNSLGNASFSTQIHVWYGPEYISNLTDQLNIRELQNTSFHCVVEGYPAPNIVWRKGGEVFQPGKHTIETTITVSTENKVVLTSYLNFTNVMENDTAIYTCEARSFRTRQQSRMLNVQYAPKLLVGSSNITVNQSMSVSFHCTAKANPPILRYNWRKGIQLSESGSTYNIQSADQSSTGTYSCAAVNSIGSSHTIFFKLTVNIPPTFTQEADCQQNRTVNKLICQCYGTGVPRPDVFWTKGVSSVIIGRGNIYEKSLTASDVSGNYICHLRNLLKEETSTYGFFLGTQPFTEWSQWGQCNVTCGDGYQSRTRSCNFQPCGNTALISFRNCTVPCAPQESEKDAVWALVLYILIPIVVLFLLILILWLFRTSRRTEDDVPVLIPVYDNLSKPPSTRSVPTNRNIYLPDSNFGTVNSAYMHDHMDDRMELKDKETPKKDDVFVTVNEADYENIEAEVRFDEDFPKDSSTDEDFEETEGTSPIAFSNDNYLEVLPDDDDDDGTQTLGTDSTEHFIKHPYGSEDEAVTSL